MKITRIKEKNSLHTFKDSTICTLHINKQKVGNIEQYSHTSRRGANGCWAYRERIVGQIAKRFGLLYHV